MAYHTKQIRRQCTLRQCWHQKLCHISLDWQHL
jgi:hypothetical protein